MVKIRWSQLLNYMHSFFINHRIFYQWLQNYFLDRVQYIFSPLKYFRIYFHSFIFKIYLYQSFIFQNILFLVLHRRAFQSSILKNGRPQQVAYFEKQKTKKVYFKNGGIKINFEIVWRTISSKSKNGKRVFSPILRMKDEPMSLINYVLVFAIGFTLLLLYKCHVVSSVTFITFGTIFIQSFTLSCLILFAAFIHHIILYYFRIYIILIHSFSNLLCILVIL